MSYNHNAIKNSWPWVRQTLVDSCLTPERIDHLSHYTTLVVGYSGGLDSSVLLHCLLHQPTLSSKVKAVHVNHGLSAHAHHWQRHCQQVCERASIDFISYQVDLKGSANLEEKARQARYAVFTSITGDNDALLLAHHANDQAETLLLQLFRGAGIDGMAAMVENKPFSQGRLIRPFLHHSRSHLEDFALRHQLIWIDDESNENRAFSRNYVRHEIIPLLKKKWPGVVNQILRSVAHCQEAKEHLDALACMDVVGLDDMGNQLRLSGLHHLQPSRVANVLRSWFKYNQVRCPSLKTLQRVIHEVILSKPDANPMIHWDDIILRRYQHTLYLLKNEKPSPPITKIWTSFPESIPWTNTGDYLYAKRSEEGLMIPPGSTLQVTGRQGGEALFWHGKTKPLKKLFQEWGIPPWSRDAIPLIYIGDELVMVVGYAINDRYYQKMKGNKSSYSIVLAREPINDSNVA